MWYHRNPNSRKWRKTSFWAWFDQNLSKNTASLVWCMDICLARVKFACRHYMSSLLVSLCDIICDIKLWYFCTMYIIDRNMCYVMSFMSSAKIAVYLRTTKLSEQWEKFWCHWHEVWYSRQKWWTMVSLKLTCMTFLAFAFRYLYETNK